jgi:hypothetical protein
MIIVKACATAVQKVTSARKAGHEVMRQKPFTLKQ